ncbi:MAG TPA: glutamate racemase [Candidatus Anaerotruncus excrementipullorum]|uniref:Glutamate racemase n=1 Tax=Candidatus Anaerotruncus excrementipullorum TaxID=2838465 RepID=A0A9D2B773_9FIRM|nr:glutamate racemase [Candidatus Anaerotruncus excrementipullorum]
MDNRAIGIIDSGLGGLTAYRELRRLLPQENLVYFGDTGRVPYGSRSRETIQKYAMQDIRFILRHHVKLVVAACGTISSTITPQAVEAIGLPFSGIVRPTAQAACQATRSGRVGLIATAATVRSGAFGRAVEELGGPGVRLTAAACPLFVPLVENGFVQPDNPVTELVARQYLQPMVEAQVDTLILGCTHYPLLSQTIQRIMGPQVTLIDSGREVARWAQGFLAGHGLLAQREQPGTGEFFVTDSAEGFIQVAGLFLQEGVEGRVTQIDVEAL